MDDSNTRKTFSRENSNQDRDYIEALDYLYGRINYERVSKPPGHGELRLRRMEALLEALGNPHADLNIVHVAGTKGKGSTVTMAAQMAAAAGLVCGTYTSPHLRMLEERFAVDGKPIASSDLAELIRHAKSAAEVVERDGDGAPTFFELTTAIAFEYFRRAECDLVAIEVGLGGRLDSTNVCSPLVTAITSIGYDHQHILGNSLTEIAREKAGIIKPTIPIVSGVRGDEASSVIRQTAAKHNAPLLQIDTDFSVHQHASESTQEKFDFLPAEGAASILKRRIGWSLGAVGIHQINNAAVALAIIDCLTSNDAKQFNIADASCQQALCSLELPARIQLYPGKPAFILDTAHNADSITALCDVLKSKFATRNIVAVFGTSADKDAGDMLDALLPSVSQVILTRYRTNPRWFVPQELAAIASQREEQNWEVVDSANQALELAQRRAGVDGLVVVCGSFFLAAELANAVEQLAGQSNAGR